jgi:hypothetical protein
MRHESAVICLRNQGSGVKQVLATHNVIPTTTATTKPTDIGRLCFEDWSFCMGSLEDRYLMAQGDVFSLQCSLATKAGEKGTQRH